MPNMPVRGVGHMGALPDLNSYDTPNNAVSICRNISFVNGNARTASVWKELDGNPTSAAELTALWVYEANGGTRTPNYLDDTGKIYSFANGTATDVTGTAVLGVISTQSTVAILGGSTFLNNRNYAPAWRAPNAADYSPLPNWSASDRCMSMRQFKDYLVAINVTKGAVDYPSMVKWSDATQSGQAPAWDPATVGTLAGENVLSDNKGKLIDGCELGNDYMIYGSDCAYRMTYVGKPFIFNFDKVLDEGGIIAQNCIASVDMVHYVFGNNDIYKTDGVSKVSIADKRVRKHIYGRIDMANAHKCHVIHDKYNMEILFCYKSKGTAAIDFGSTNFANEAAIYNYREDSWSFRDLPGVASGVAVAIPTVISWATAQNWDSSDAMWLAFAGNPPETVLASVNGPTTDSSRLLFLDQREGGFLNNPVSSLYDYEATLSFSMKDYDDIGLDAFDHKYIRAIRPHLHVIGSANYVDIQFSTAFTIGSGEIPETPIRFYPVTDVKADTRTHNRYISVQFTIPAGTYAELSGFDMDINMVSKR